MKTIILTFFISCSFFMVNAQSDKIDIVNLQTDSLKKENKIDNQKLSDCSELNSNKRSTKNKKHIFKKMVLGFQGVEYKNAWELISMN